MSDEETLRLYEDDLDVTGHLPAETVRGLIAEVRSLRDRVGDALIHYQIGQECRLGLVYVDWAYVADRMAGALDGVEEAAG